MVLAAPQITAMVELNKNPEEWRRAYQIGTTSRIMVSLYNNNLVEAKSGEKLYPSTKWKISKKGIEYLKDKYTVGPDQLA